MRTNTFAFTTVPLLVLLATPAHADMVWTNATHALSAEVLDQNATDTYAGLGYTDRSTSISERNDFGVTTAKVNHESLTRDGLIKSTTMFSLHSQAGSPGFAGSGSSIDSDFMFSISSRTTFELLYSTIDHSDTFDTFNLSITDASGAAFFNLSENRQIQGTQLITLEAGDYTLNETSGITGVSAESFGRWDFTTSFTLRVVPAPATLGMLAAPALLLTRRRRS